MNYRNVSYEVMCWASSAESRFSSQQSSLSWRVRVRFRSCCCLFASSFENLIQCTIIFAKYLCKSCLLDMCAECAGRARVLLHILFALHWNIYVEHIIVYLENTNWMRKTGLTELCRELPHRSEWSKWSAYYVHYFWVVLFFFLVF